MLLIASVLFASGAAAAAASNLVAAELAPHGSFNGLVERLVCAAVPPGPNLCARSCGAGNVACVTLTKCFNPSAGESCCSNGSMS